MVEEVVACGMMSLTRYHSGISSRFEVIQGQGASTGISIFLVWPSILIFLPLSHVGDSYGLLSLSLGMIFLISFQSTRMSSNILFWCFNNPSVPFNLWL